MGNIGFQENRKIYVLVIYKTGTKLCRFSMFQIPYLGYFYKKGHYPVLIYQR